MTKNEAKKEVMNAVINQIENFFCNDLTNEWGTSNFEYWCEEQFDNHPDPEACYKLAKEIAPLVNELEWKLAKYAGIA